jgi:hypothetical protein
MRVPARAQLPRSAHLIEHTPQVVRVPLAGVSARWPIPARTTVGSRPGPPEQRRHVPTSINPLVPLAGYIDSVGLWTRILRQRRP